MAIDLFHASPQYTLVVSANDDNVFNMFRPSDWVDLAFVLPGNLSCMKLLDAIRSGILAVLYLCSVLLVDCLESAPTLMIYLC